MKGDKEIIENKCKEFNFKLIDEDFNYDSNRDAKFKVLCLNCGKISTKSFVTLVKRETRCKYCYERTRNYHNSIEEVLPLIYAACDEYNYTFLGFVGGEWKKCRNTKLLLKCNNCGIITEKNYDNFINKGAKCVCNRKNKLKEKNTLPIEEVNKTIEKVSKCHDVIFLEYINKENKYFNNETKLKFKCKKCGRIICRAFKNVRTGSLSCECCTQSSLEKLTKQKLIENDVLFEEQKKFNWLKNKNNLSLDFYLPEYNIAIECQGVQHFKPIEHFGGERVYEAQKKRDTLKLELCETHNISIIYILNNDDIDNIDRILYK